MPGINMAENCGVNKKGDRVIMKGKAVFYMKGEIYLNEE